MADQRQDRFSPPALGGTSLLTVFAVLCLTIFALLSLATVQADRRLGDSAAQAVSDYYAADCTAQKILAQLRLGRTVAGVKVEETRADYADSPDEPIRSCSYAVPISDTQELRVEVRLHWTDYEILRWQAVPIGDWSTSETLQIWDGEDF